MDHKTRLPRAVALVATLIWALVFIVLPEPSLARCAPIPGTGSVQASAPVSTGDQNATPRSINSWLVKQAVELLADSIKHGTRFIHYVVKHLDDDAAKVFYKHSRPIADALYKIAKIPDVTVKVVKQKLIYFLTGELHVSYATAQVIGEAVEGALWVLL